MAGRRAPGLVLAALVWGSILGSARAQQPAPAAADQLGTIAGTVLDKTNGEAVIEAGVEVVGTGKKGVTDLDGKYRIRVPPGIYQVRIYAPLYQSVRLQNVVVKANEVATADASLATSGQAGVETVEVVAQANKQAEATQLLQRKAAPVVSDTISAETIKKNTGSDAADVVTRAPAVTVRDDKFVYVRGLGERYSSALLNGSRLPSTDPQKRVVPLDLFPADFIQSLSIIKSYTPDLPGDFSGGLVDINLKEFPEELAFNLGFSTGANTQTTFQDFLTYPGSPLDNVTYGEIFRGLPTTVPPPGTSVTPRQNYAIARSFRDIWETDVETAPPNFGANFSVGDSIGPFGFQLGAVWSNEYETKNNQIQRLFRGEGTVQNPELKLADNFLYNESTLTSKIGSVFTGSYEINESHRLNLRGLWNRNAYDDTQFGVGTTENLSANSIQQQTVLRYTDEELVFGQLQGEHRIPWVQVDWETSIARTRQEEPDTRFTTYQGPQGGPLVFDNDSSGGLRVFNNLNELETDDRLNITVPFKTRLPYTDVWSDLPAKFKFGPAYTYRKRDFLQRRFRYIASEGFFDLSLPANQLLAPENIGPGGIQFVEQTVPKDAFNATEEIIGGYGMFDLPLVKDRLRFIGGVRTEYSLIRLQTADDAGNPVNQRKKNVDPLPGTNFVYSPRDDMNIRFGFSKTVSRPEFRELSPVLYPTPRGQRPVIGNPDLVEAKITSWDARWEWFFTPLELVSLSFFHKTLEQPIEQSVVELGSGVADSFFNADKGKVTGFEFEGRKDFGFLNRRLDNLSFLTNVTYASSEVTVTRTSETDVITNLEHSLQGQAPYVVNAALDYTDENVSARLLYNTVGPFITTAGAFGLPDYIQQRTERIDAVVAIPLQRYLGLPVTMKLSAENITNDPIEVTQADQVQERFTEGVKFGLGFSYTY